MPRRSVFDLGARLAARLGVGLALAMLLATALVVLGRKAPPSAVAPLALGACLAVVLVGAGGLLAGRQLAERLAAEDELRESLRRFRGIFEQAAVGIGQLSPDGRWLWTNRRLSEILRTPREDLLGSAGVRLFGADGEDASLDDTGRVRRLLRGELDTVTGERCLRLGDGSLGWVEHTLSATRRPEGDIDFLICVVEDIDERKRADLALRESEERFRVTFEQAAVGIAHVTVDGIWLRVNRRLCEILGYPLAALLAVRQHEISHPDDFDAELRQASALLRNEISTSALEVRYLRRDGSIVWVNLTMSLARRSTAEAPYLIKVIEEVTERKLAQLKEEVLMAQLSRAKEMAEGASRAKSDFLAGMSHELRTPLNSIIGFSEVLADGRCGPLEPRQERYAKNILASGHHLLLLVNEVLDLARVEAGRMSLDRRSFDCRELIADVAGTVQALAQPKQIALSVALDEALPPVVADSDKLKQILYNLLSNAIKFTPERGRVELRASFQPAAGGAAAAGRGVLHLAVADTGIGILREDLQHLFKEFVRLDSRYGRRQEGTGLGLALTRKLAELHGGRVWAESEGEGRGSTFHLLLPVDPLPRQLSA